MTLRKTLMLAAALVLLVPAVAGAIERTVLFEKFSNGW